MKRYRALWISLIVLIIGAITFDVLARVRPFNSAMWKIVAIPL